MRRSAPRELPWTSQAIQSLKHEILNPQTIWEQQNGIGPRSMLSVQEERVPVPGLPVSSSRAQPQGKTAKPVARTGRDKDPERFYCPFPSCNRSFAELWRLKVHYRAPPDVRGSGKERGHGCELQYCPKCGKELRAGKHHVGCFAGRTAPRHPAKRFKVPLSCRLFLMHRTHAEAHALFGTTVRCGPYARHCKGVLSRRRRDRPACPLI